MPGMGTTGTVNITPEMLHDAVKAITEYRTTTDTLCETVKAEIEGLVAHDFTGSASRGFESFYRNNIEPATNASLKNILDTLENICDSIRSAIPDTDGVDEQLGNANNQQEEG